MRKHSDSTAGKAQSASRRCAAELEFESERQVGQLEPSLSTHTINTDGNFTGEKRGNKSDKERGKAQIKKRRDCAMAVHLPTSDLNSVATAVPYAWLLPSDIS